MVELPAVMGIVNVTPDSFSDGGRFTDPGLAAAHGALMASAGAAVVDVGGESTRPGAHPVDAAEEARRVVPVIRRLAREAGVAVSVDTTKAAVAAAALEAGATMVNDISAGRADPAMLGLVATAGCDYVAMHMQGTPATMQDGPSYADVVAEVIAFLSERIGAATEAGVEPGRILADPGIGFGKAFGHNAVLLQRLDELVEAIDAPVLVGTSRKAFLGFALAHGDHPAPVDEREEATLATVVLALTRGAQMVRVHDVAPAVAAVRLLAALDPARPAGRPAGRPTAQTGGPAQAASWA